MSRLTATLVFLVGLLLSATGVGVIAAFEQLWVFVSALVSFAVGVAMIVFGSRARGELSHAGGAVCVLVATLAGSLLRRIGLDTGPIGVVVNALVVGVLSGLFLWLVWPRIARKLV